MSHKHLSKKICSFYPALPYDDKHIDTIEYKKWTSTDRSLLESVTQSVEDFVQSFSEQLELLVRHDFVSRMQSEYLKNLKVTLRPGEVIVLGDFAENYAMVTQDEIQSHHWGKVQATIHPFVAYWREGNETQHLSYAAISDCLTHDTVAVHIFQKKLISYLDTKMGMRPQIINYFSDGCAAQYKNCNNLLNLTFHFDDFGVDAEWHFFATAHGKGACDGVGGTLKRLAAKASLQKTVIETPVQFFEFLQKYGGSTYVEYVENAEIAKESLALKDRFATARTVPGTRKVHAVRPLRRGVVAVTWFSGSVREEEVRVCRTSV